MVRNAESMVESMVSSLLVTLEKEGKQALTSLGTIVLLKLKSPSFDSFPDVISDISSKAYDILKTLGISLLIIAAA